MYASCIKEHAGCLERPASDTFNKGLPWDIEVEPGGKETCNLKRPFEAKKGNAMGHTLAAIKKKRTLLYQNSSVQVARALQLPYTHFPYPSHHHLYLCSCRTKMQPNASALSLGLLAEGEQLLCHSP